LHIVGDYAAIRRQGNEAEVLSTLRSLANAILGRTGKPNRLDAGTHMAMEADFNDRGEPSTQERATMLKMDQIDELIRVLGAQGIEPEPPRGRSSVLSFPDHRRRSKGRR
jgi:hypothetical protein